MIIVTIVVVMITADRITKEAAEDRSNMIPMRDASDDLKLEALKRS